VSLEVLSARQSGNGIALTLATERGIEPLEGSCGEIAHLARVMQQIGALAAANECENVWIEDVPVGDAIVRLGLKSGRQARIQILRP
jgi:hypothetical protein